jgi:D-glycero-D-manno-heptose 1,7-bisphosphate phosphatase
MEGRFHENLGMWIRLAQQPPRDRRPALFLDRDGVIAEDPGYLHRPIDLALIPGSADLIAYANRLGIPVVEVTNQAGVGRGYYSWSEFVEVEEALARDLALAGASLDGVFACPYHRDALAPCAHPDHPARKPRSGMFVAAARLLNLDLRHSWIVGDKISDLQAGFNAGLRGALHVLTGHGSEHRQTVREWPHPDFDLRLGDSIADATILPLLDRS